MPIIFAKGLRPPYSPAIFNYAIEQILRGYFFPNGPVAQIYSLLFLTSPTMLANEELDVLTAQPTKTGNSMCSSCRMYSKISKLF